MSDQRKVEGNITCGYQHCKIYGMPNKALLIFKGDTLVARVWYHSAVKKMVIGVEDDICLTEETLSKITPFYNIRFWRLMIKRGEMHTRNEKRKHNEESI